MRPQPPGSALFPSGAIDRPLVAEIVGSSASLVILEAPAGFGKSTLLMQAFNIHAAHGHSVVWLSLDDDGEDCRTFLISLVLAMTHIPLDLNALQQQAARGFSETPTRVIVHQLCEAIASQDRTIYFFIDNLDAATDQVMPIIETLATRLSKTCRFHVATRIHASSSLAKLRAAGIVAIFGARDLRLNHDEGRALLSGCIEGPEADAIIDQVEGWPVMVQLIRLSMGRADAPLRGIPAVCANSSDLAEYLSEQVMQRLSPEIQQILMRLSLCERFNGDLLNVICDRNDGWNLISSFLKQGLLLVPVDGAATWYRFHSIFGEFLLERFRREDASQSPVLHRQAAQWFARQTMINDAIRHANAAGDIAFTTQLLADAGGWIVAFRGGTKALRIIGGLPADVLDANPYLRLGQIYLMAQESRLQDARSTFNTLMDQAKSTAFRSPDDESLFRVSAGVLDALLCVYEVKHIDPQSLAALRTSNTSPVPDQLAAMITHLLGFSHYCDGNYPAARQICPVAAEQCRDAGADFVAIYAYLALGDTYLEMANLERAEHYFNLAGEIASKNFGPESNQVVASRVFLAEVAYERDDIDRAAGLIQSVLPGIEHRDPWSSVYMSAHRVAAEVLCRRNGWEAAIEFIDQAAGRLERHELGTVYTPYLRVKKAEILMRNGQLGAASWSLVADENLQAENKEQQRSRSEMLRMFASTRLTLIQGGGDVSLRQLDRMAPMLRARQQKRRLIKVHALKAAAHHQQGRPGDAFKELEIAASMARASKMLAPILEEMPLLEPLLRGDAGRAAFRDALGEDPVGLPGPRVVPAPAIAAPAGARPRLSERERQVLTMLADGLSCKEIAIQTRLALNTVMSYRKTLYKKLDARSRSTTIAAGREFGYLQK